MLSKNSTHYKPELYNWYERIYSHTNYTSIVGDYKGLFTSGGPCGKGVSTYLPETVKLLLGKIPHNYYILCPIYSVGDFQLGVTGTSHFNETPDRTISRELMEELGIFPKKYSPMVIKFNQNIITYGSNININNTRINKQNFKIVGKDNKRNKIAVIVYGEEQDILNKYLTKKIIQFENTDNIIGVMSVPMTAIYKYLEF